MSNTKLIIVEGIPGSGKTTTAEHIKKLLDKAKVENILFSEGNLDHPADFEAVACLTDQEYDKLIDKFSSQKDFLENNIIKKGKNRFLHYRKLNGEQGSNMSEELFNEIIRYDVCDGLSLERYQELTLERWGEFAEKAHKEDKVYIFECCFIQNPAVVMLARHLAEKEKIMNHVLQIESIIKKLNPTLIYFYQNSVRETIERVAESRDKGWINFVTDYICNQQYGIKHGLSGFDGVVSFFEYRRQIELEIIEKLDIEKIVLDNSDYNWCKRYEEIEQTLKSSFDQI